MTTKYHPILCTPAVALALREGRQTQDRRPIKPQPEIVQDCEPEGYSWVPMYRGRELSPVLAPWQPGDVLWLARTFLLVESVRAQRIQDISEKDARAEGCASITTFRALWNSLYSARGLSWDANPWVWAYNLKLTAKPKGWPEVK